MNFLYKTQLLIALRGLAQRDQGEDWQTLHQRDRAWFLSQQGGSRWSLVERWLIDNKAMPTLSLRFPGGLASIVGLFSGVGLMSGLLQLSSPQRINLLWWLLFAVLLPLLFWLLGLLLARHGSATWMKLLANRRQLIDGDSSSGLWRLSSSVLAQQFGLAFSVGLLVCFGVYLLLTDLAFGWATTLEFTAQGMHRITGLLATPWQGLWPTAVPSLELIERTRVFRTAEPGFQSLARAWWPFLLMNLLCYNLLPRLASYGYFRWRLGKAQRRLFEQDAAVAGWWQRLHSECIVHQAEPVQQANLPDSPLREPTPGDAWPSVERLICWGEWPRQLLNDLRADFPGALGAMEPQVADQEAPEGRSLVLCKGWEPPTGALLDYCRSLPESAEMLLWPVALPGMSTQRVIELRRSWEMAEPNLPVNCVLFEPPDED